MKKIITLFFALSCVLALVGCSKIKEPATPTSNIEDTVSTETETQIQNEILQFFADKYNMKFTLWGPEGHAERECLILMPANTDDVAECIKNLAWEVVGDELIITGGWQETFKIDITAETATSTATGKVYQIYEMQSELR